MEDWALFDIVRVIIFWTSPVVFVLGLILLTYSKYTKLEEFLAKEFGMRKKIFPGLEKNIYLLHNWCLKKRVLIGIACIIYALVVFLLLHNFSSLEEVIGEV
ncbi:MAG: hypothetical protein PHQ84_05510 [Candidatus Omnitrophica bacterium]|nr:hypothetical protein [Candidatus Omnitrophota bacterium]MDD3274239.1 hypothetical protein [Candidatus Omnitrophota bacterium]MDD5078441.1 hypothetical protein [Candidatus Omnitrophota bacterium]MDD5724649.1 hypothetical protein [Candidatus Omnitrophota bacterium]